MSNTMIPCKHPWTPLTYSKCEEIVKVRITKCDRIQDYELHVPILRHYSGYFRTKLPETNDADRRPDVILEVENPAAFDAYTIWLYQGTLSRPGASRNMPRLSLCQIYVFGLRSDTPSLQNAVIDAFITRLTLDDTVPYDIIAYIETHALASKLDDLVLDIVKHCGKQAVIEDWVSSFSPGSFKLVRGRTSKKVGVKEYLEEMMVCGKWHVHPEADDRDGESFWFDPPVRKAEGMQ